MSKILQQELRYFWNFGKMFALETLEKGICTLPHPLPFSSVLSLLLQKNSTNQVLCSSISISDIAFQK